MDARSRAAVLWRQAQNRFNLHTPNNPCQLLMRKKRIVMVVLGVSLLLFLVLLLLQAGPQAANDASRIVKADTQMAVGFASSGAGVSSQALLLETAGEDSGGSSDEDKGGDERVPGYRKSSDFFRSIVRGNAHASCVGSDETRGEVEDLLCMPKPDYDPRMKNPCWWENITQTPAPGVQAPSHSVSSLSCLPYFHLLCCSKSGTTDLYRRISMHPDLVPNFGIFGKERLWWGWLKYGIKNRHERGTPTPFYKYVKGFGVLARYLEKAAPVNAKPLKRLITLDGSPNDMWELRGWPQLPQNRGLRQPAVTTPHIMRHLYRDPRFIVMARDPVERLYTAYLFHGFGKTSEEFHIDVIKNIAIFNQCLARAEDRIECFVNDTVIQEMTVDLHFSCYAVYFEEWLKVFPKKHFLFLRTEDYSKDIRSALLAVFQFLDLHKPSSTDLQKMVAAPTTYHTKQRDLAGPMMQETRALLRAWFKPWNEELARLLKDKAYLWNDV